jgi:hypothetical protein
MKFIAAVLFLSLTAAAAAPNEVECAGPDVAFVVRGEATGNGNFKDAELRFWENGELKTVAYRVSTTTGLQRVEYQARGFKLTVDLWPDAEPDWGTVYSGTLLSTAIRNTPALAVDCRYP